MNTDYQLSPNLSHDWTLKKFIHTPSMLNTKLTYLCCFSPEINHPPSLTKMETQQIHDVYSFPHLTHLIIDSFDSTLDHLPASLTNLTLHDYKLILDKLPPKLKVLSIGYESPIEYLPSTLTVLKLTNFNHPIDHFPQSLPKFNHPIDNLPQSLTQLHLEKNLISQLIISHNPSLLWEFVVNLTKMLTIFPLLLLVVILAKDSTNQLITSHLLSKIFSE